MCDQVATEIVPSGEDYGEKGSEEREEAQRKIVTYRGSATEK